MKAVIFPSFLIGCFWGTAAYAGLLGPGNYDECITDSMKGVKSDYAAQQIDAACQRRFPEGKGQAQVLRSLSPEGIALLTGRARAVSQGANYFVGSIYNGNRQGTVKSVTIYLMPKIPVENFQEMAGATAMTGDSREPSPRGNSSLLSPADDIEKKKQEADGHLRYYHLSVEIPPLTTKNFSVQVLESSASDQDYEWGIADAEVD